MSEQSDLLLNELVAACVAFGREIEPDWQTRIGKAQDALKAYITKLEEAQRWIPVSEKLPEDNKLVLVYDADGRMESDFLWRNDIGGDGFMYSSSTVIHWMPLPNPPIEEREK